MAVLDMYTIFWRRKNFLLAFIKILKMIATKVMSRKMIEEGDRIVKG